jgi:hypothetical protein
MGQPLVSLVIAWEWVCPTCEALQYVSAAPATMTESETQEIAKQMEVDPDVLRESGLAVVPLQVRCRECKNRFPVEQPAEE